MSSASISPDKFLGVASNLDSLPLTGFRVVEFGQYIAVPGASQILLDQGATVIKIEPPGGEACRRMDGFGAAMFHAYNRGKRMTEIDLASDHGRNQARQLIADADVVLSNMKPGALERYGLSATDMHEINASAVILTLNGFGESEAMRARPGLDITAQAESGIMWVTGEAEQDPQRVGFTVVDAAAAVTAAQAVTAALLQRSRTGEGTHIRLSLWDVALHLQAANWMDWFLSGREPIRKGNGQPNAAPAADVVRVQDGYVVVSAYMPHQWRALCEAAGRPEMADDPRYATSADRVVHREAWHADLAAALAGSTRDEVVELLSSAGVVVGSIRDYPDAFRVRMSCPGPIFIEAQTTADPPRHYVGSPLDWAGAAPLPQSPRLLGADNNLLDLHPTDLWQQASSPVEN